MGFQLCLTSWELNGNSRKSSWWNYKTKSWIIRIRKKQSFCYTAGALFCVKHMRMGLNSVRADFFSRFSRFSFQKMRLIELWRVSWQGRVLLCDVWILFSLMMVVAYSPLWWLQLVLPYIPHQIVVVAYSPLHPAPISPYTSSSLLENKRIPMNLSQN